MQDSNLSSKLEAIVKAKTDGEVSDNISIYIGYSLLGLGFLNGITNVPDAFIIGATISGFCFAMVDIINLGEAYKRFIKPLTITGIVCLFLLPIVLTVYPHPLLLDFFGLYSDMGTFYALGFVMIALGLKSRQAKVGFITTTFEVIEELVKENGQTKHDLIILEREYKERMEEYQNKIANFEDELKNVKEISNANRTKDFSKI